MEPDLITDPTAQQVAEVERGLGEYDLQFLPGRSSVAIKGVLVESDRVVAGLYGEMFWGRCTHSRRMCIRTAANGDWGAG